MAHPRPQGSCASPISPGGPERARRRGGGGRRGGQEGRGQEGRVRARRGAGRGSRGREGGARRGRGNGRGEEGLAKSELRIRPQVLCLSHQRIIFKGDNSERLCPYRSTTCPSPSGELSVRAALPVVKFPVSLTLPTCGVTWRTLSALAARPLAIPPAVCVSLRQVY